MPDTIKIDRYVLDTLMADLVGHDRRTSAYLVFLFVLGAERGRPVVLSHQQIADGTGLSKRTVQNAIAHLGRRGLLAIARRGRTDPLGLRTLPTWRR